LPGATETAASFQFEGEGHTLGNALRYMIMKKWVPSCFISLCFFLSFCCLLDRIRHVQLVLPLSVSSTQLACLVMSYLTMSWILRLSQNGKHAYLES